MVLLAFREELSLAERLILVLLLGLNPFLLEQSNSIGSHLPFLALFYLAIFLLGRAEKDAVTVHGKALDVAGTRRVPSAVSDCTTDGTRRVPATFRTVNGFKTPHPATSGTWRPAWPATWPSPREPSAHCC